MPAKQLRTVLRQTLIRSVLLSFLFTLLISLLLIILVVKSDMPKQGSYLSRLVFTEVRNAMNSGANFNQIKTIIDQLGDQDRGIHYQLYRGEQVAQQFGEGNHLSAQLLDHLGDNDSLTDFVSLDEVQYFDRITFTEECQSCHLEVQVGDTAGLLQVSFPVSEVKIPLVQMLIAFFAITLASFAFAYLLVKNQLIIHLVRPLRMLEMHFERTKPEQELHIPVELESSLDVVKTIETAYNNQQQRLHEVLHELKTLSALDGLTGILNRHQLMPLLNEESSRAVRTEKPLSLAMIDLNGFKQINDTYGHQAGDEILIYFVKSVREELRTTDRIIRYGGDEFILLLPDCSEAQSQQTFKRLRARFADQPFIFKECPIEVVFSVGVAEFPRESQSDEAFELIPLADRRMYREKAEMKAVNPTE